MPFQAPGEVVRKNIEKFERILERLGSSLDRKEPMIELFFHKIEGEISFSPPKEDPSKWEALALHLFPLHGQGAFSMDVSNLQGDLFSWEGVSPLALHALQQTIHVARLVMRQRPCRQGWDALLKQLSTGDFIHEAWHLVDRSQCEHILACEEEGTFLFRKDFFADVLEEQLHLRHQQPIRCITLSCLAPGKRVLDFTLVQKNTGWLIYQGDPSLQGLFFPSLSTLLEHFDPALTFPLFYKAGEGDL